MVLSFGKHSYGLNLQEYSIMVLWEKHWDYASREQPEGEYFARPKQRMPVLSPANAGLDTIMDKNIAKKGRLLDYFKNKSVKKLKKNWKKSFRLRGLNPDVIKLIGPFAMHPDVIREMKGYPVIDQ